MKKLEEILKGEPKYRLTQCYKAIFYDLISDWQEATALPASLREKLAKEFSLEIKSEFFDSVDEKTTKALISLEDDSKIETVLMRHKDDRRTICVSCQVGCPLNCEFCATGQMGFKRNLSSWEIVIQVLIFARFLEKTGDGNRISNIVFMGMGEPFLNYENVMEAVRILNGKDAFNIGARHISISTAGITEGIEKFSGENLQVNLAISLHAPNDNLRNRLMPINEKYPLKNIFRAVDSYIEKTSRKVMFEYLLIDGVNDSDDLAYDLAELMRKSLYMVNLIPCNSVGVFKPSPSERVMRFKEILEREGVNVTQRFRFGRDIKGACGQLAGSKIKHETL
jgi:23S rRNA (adenine2503-C2)-methyltransferase